MHPSLKPDVENEDEVHQNVVADVFTVEDTVDVEDVVDEFLNEDVDDVDLDNFPCACTLSEWGAPDSDSNPHRRGP